MQAVGKLVKLFQGEIDRLTNAENYAETAYLSLCEGLTKLPDPSEALKRKRDVDEEAEQQLKTENTKLKAEVSSLQKELDSVRSRLIRLLMERRFTAKILPCATSKTRSRTFNNLWLRKYEIGL